MWGEIGTGQTQAILLQSSFAKRTKTVVMYVTYKKTAVKQAGHTPGVVLWVVVLPALQLKNIDLFEFRHALFFF